MFWNMMSNLSKYNYLKIKYFTKLGTTTISAVAFETESGADLIDISGNEIGPMDAKSAVVASSTFCSGKKTHQH